MPLSDSALVPLRQRLLAAAKSVWLFTNPETDNPYTNIHYSMSLEITTLLL